MLNRKQQAVLEYTRKMLKELFVGYYLPAHGINHILRVEGWAAMISRREKADEYICRLAALLHDVGRIKVGRDKQREHHEYSYQLCRKLFRTDPILKTLPRGKKIELLYGVRYHWNNAADEYFSAAVLRDADKLDALGRVGLQRALEFYATEDELLNGFRYIAAYLSHFATTAAREIVKKTRPERPLLDYERKLLRKKIKPIKL